MPKWIDYAILKSAVEQLEAGLRLREISKLIKTAHPKGQALNPGNITQALISASSLQVKKNIRPMRHRCRNGRTRARATDPNAKETPDVSLTAKTPM
jgi:hypothetical protein